MMADECYRTGNPERRAMVDLGGVRTVALRAAAEGRTLLGFIVDLSPGSAGRSPTSRSRCWRTSPRRR